MISQAEWRSIYVAIRRVADRSREIIEGIVIDRDETTQSVFLQETGPEPVPLVGFDYRFKTYLDRETDYALSNEAREVIVEPVLPEIGDRVVVARIGGARGSARCIGIVRMGRPWRQPKDTEV